MAQLQRLVIHGRAHPKLGRVVVDGLEGKGWSAGLAHSRGIRNKKRPSLSPNEDSAFVVTDGETFVWAGVADGHHGDYSSWHAVEYLAARPELLLADHETVVDFLFEANIRLERERPHEQPESRTTVVAMRIDLTTGELRWVSMGDSTVGLQPKPGGYTRLNYHQHWFHGYWLETRYSAAMNWEFGMETMKPGSVALLASDGWTDFIPGGSSERLVVEAATTDTANAERAAEQLVRAAFMGRAGDHVTTVVVALNR